MTEKIKKLIFGKNRAKPYIAGILVFIGLLFAVRSWVSNTDVSSARQEETPSLEDPGGKKVEFAYTDDNSGENLIIKTNEKTFFGLSGAKVYFSVNNVGGKDDSVGFQAYFPEKNGEVKSLKQKNQTGWQEITLSSDSLSSGKNIIDQLVYKNPKRKPVPEDLRIEKSTGGEKVKIAAGETQYFEMDISFKTHSEGEFYIEAVGDRGGYGLLDPWWSSSWSYRKPITIDHDRVGIISSLTANANVDQKDVVVQDGSLFAASDTVVIKSDTNEETNTVSSVSGNTLTMQNNLVSNFTTANNAFVKNTTDSADLTNFPVLVDLATDSDLASDALDSGYDIAFADNESSVTQYNHEIENFDGDTGELQAWVRIPTLSTSADTIIYMYYGNSEAADQQNINGTWNSNYKTVHHMEDLTTSTTDDSTSYGFNGTKTSAGNPAETSSGKIDRAQDFSSDSINHGDLGMTATTAYTAEAWIKADTLYASGDRTTYGSTVFASANSGNGYPLWLTIGKGGGTNDEVTLRAFTTSTTGVNTSGADLNTTDWFHIVAVATKSGPAKVYVNGVQRLSTTAGTTSWTSIFTIGDLRPARAIYFDGIIDEVRISDIVRDFGWIRTSYNNQSSPSSFISLGAEETETDAIVSTTGDQASSLTIPSAGQYIGTGNGAAFAIAETTSSRNVTGITITENGTVDAQNDLSNVKLYYENDTSAPYDCASESYGGSESQFGSTGSFNGADGTASFSGSVGISTTSTMCVYVVLDVDDTANNNDTLEVEINNPSTDVTVSSGLIGPAAAVELSGTTSLQTPTDMEEIHYRWRNDDAGESNEPPWYNSSWSYRKKLTIDNNLVSGTADFTNFPVLVSFTDSNLATTGNGGHVENSSGYDIIFSDDAQSPTKLDHEIEKYVASTGEIVMWVEIPTLKYNEDTDFYIYYGNSGISSSQENKTGVWDSDNIMVQHLNEDPSTGTEPRMKDSTSNNDMTTSNLESGDLVSSQIGDGIQFAEDTVNPEYLIKNPVSSFPTTAITAEYWIKSDQSGEGMISYEAGSNEFLIFDQSNINVYRGATSVATGISANDNNWHNIVVTWDDATDALKVYKDGGTTPDYSGTLAAGSITAGGSLVLGNEQDSVGGGWQDGQHFTGVLDEVRISNSIRTGDYIETTYQNQVNQGTGTSKFIKTKGTEQPISSGASWAANEDTELTGLAKETIRRLRLEISNEGGQTASSVEFRLEVSEPNPSTCSGASYERISTNADWEMADSAYVTDGDGSVNVLSGLTDANPTFITGELKDTGDQTGAISLTGTQFTELEYSVAATGSATGGATYCFRLTDNGSDALFSYPEYPEITLEEDGSQTGNSEIEGSADFEGSATFQ